MFLYKQVPAERLSGLNRFSLMGKPLLGLILITRIRASHGSCNHPDGLSPRKRKSESVIIGINKSVKSAQSVVLLLASVFCLRQTQVFTSEPKFVYKNKLLFLILATQNVFFIFLLNLSHKKNILFLFFVYLQVKVTTNLNLWTDSRI